MFQNQENDKKSSAVNHADKVNDKLKESKLKKPEVMTKRKANVEEDERPRKRIRPLLQRERQSAAQ